MAKKSLTSSLSACLVDLKPMSIAQSPLMRVTCAVLAWVQRAGRNLGQRRWSSKFNDRQLLAMHALQRCFGTDNRWMTGVVADTTALKDELKEQNWRELAQRFIERG